ncbi:MAG TPA: tetratricopeptide repeat protein [Myxococcota bacterium]|nr:tetratricopeptide repeat protein [Myxococcota bacterium]HRY93659.1 tetratricopeptide repeat protein [Myxococcota bacterium]HSA20992.1 tetratricopeptide repeat protein [Myxococcota bacterium]
MATTGRTDSLNEHRGKHLQGRRTSLLWCLVCAGVAGGLACSSPEPATQAPPEVKPPEAQPAEVKPPEAQPAEAKPAEAAPAARCDPKQSPAACWQAAQELEKNAKTFEDWDRVYALKESACDAGAPVESCYDAAANYWEKDKREPAERYYLKGCDKGHAPSCAGLGNLYASEPKGKEDAPAGRPEAKGPDYAQAVKYLEKACQLKDPDGCAGLGILVADGKGAKKDITRAVGLWEKACQLGSDVDCLTVGRFLAAGRGEVKKDVARARKAFDAACKRKYEDACKAAQELGGK